jgi:mono/diheme cytochrome c family protein
MKKAFSFFAVVSIVLISSCYYDAESELYGVKTCDNSVVTYNGRIKAIMETNCNNCHSGSNPSAGYATDTYANTVASDADGKLNCTIAQGSGCSPMPQGGKLSQCDIDACAAWATQGYPEN